MNKFWKTNLLGNILGQLFSHLQHQDCSYLKNSQELKLKLRVIILLKNYNMLYYGF